MTTTNANKAAAAAITSVTGVTSGSNAMAAGTTATSVAPRSLGRITADVIKRAQAVLSSPQQSVVAATTNSSGACLVSGTYTVSLTDNGAVPPVYTAMSIAFNNCSDTVGETANGSISMSGLTATSTAFAGTFSANLTYAVTGLPTMGMVGGYTVNYTLNASDWSGTISGTSFSVYEGSTKVNTLSNFSFTNSFVASTTLYTYSVNFTLDSTDIGGRVSVATIQPVSQLQGRIFPNAGQVTVTGTGGSKVRVTVNGDETHISPQVTIDLDANGDGVYESTTNVDWATLIV